MKSISSVFAAFILLSLLLAGCSGGNKLVGTWEGTVNGTMGTVTFNPNNTFALVVSNPQNAAQKVTLTGDYDLKDDKLTITPKDANPEGFTPEEAQQVKQQATQNMGKPDTATIAFKSDTEVEITNDKGVKSTLKKK